MWFMLKFENFIYSNLKNKILQVSDEDQRHIFTQCENIMSETNTHDRQYNNIFSSDVKKV